MSILTKGVGRYPAIGGAYQGPGDVVSGALAWWGLRGYSAAYSTGSNKGIQVADAATGATTTDINILSNGYLDVATIAALGYAVEVSKLYDQTGNGFDLSGTHANRSVLTLNDNGSLPCITLSGGAYELASGATAVTTNQPFSMVAVARKTSSAGLATISLFVSGILQGAFSATANNVTIYPGLVDVAGATDGSTHALGWLFNNASSKISVNGTSTGVNMGSAQAMVSGNLFKFPTSSSGAFTGKLWESGWWGSDISSSFAALSTNQHTHWNF